ncbi:MAG TPA: hypothetical protein VGY54_06600 [Polyangiaceae bacterium]|nr:hypothetical protein [Polyangiaceae bacterium]
MLAKGSRGKRIIQLFGPREYSPNDVAAALGRVVGKPIVAHRHPEEAMGAAHLARA